MPRVLLSFTEAGMIISVVNQKGGVGKTTTAVNLAVGLAQLSHPTLLVDLDPQANATSGLGLSAEGNPSLYASISSPDGSGSLPQAMATAVDRLKVVGSSPDLAGAEVDLAHNQARDDLRRVLRGLEAAHPLIVVDTPPSLSLLTVNALVAADQLVIPVQCEYFALEGLGHLLRTLERVKRSLNRQLGVLGLVRTMYNPRLGLSSQVSAELERHFPQLLFKTHIPRNVRLAEAPGYGQPIALFDPRSAGAQAYARLAEEVELRAKLPRDAAAPTSASKLEVPV